MCSHGWGSHCIGNVHPGPCPSPPRASCSYIRAFTRSPLTPTRMRDLLSFTSAVILSLQRRCLMHSLKISLYSWLRHLSSINEKKIVSETSAFAYPAWFDYQVRFRDAVLFNTRPTCAFPLMFRMLSCPRELQAYFIELASYPASLPGYLQVLGFAANVSVSSGGITFHCIYIVRLLASVRQVDVQKFPPPAKYREDWSHRVWSQLQIMFTSHWLCPTPWQL